MNFLLGRDGKISVFRVGVAAAVLGILFIVGGIIIFSIEQTTYAQPLNIDPYPNAIDWGTIVYSNTSRSLRFKIPNKTPEDVVAYYQQKLDEFYGKDTSDPNAKCQRIPAAGNSPDYDPTKSDKVPYYYTCMFDRSGFNTLQSTQVKIQPGVKNSDPKLDSEGATVVSHDQQWQ
jgi:hypothetical protein